MIKSDDGFCVTKKSFDLDKLGQAVLYKLKEHEVQINQNTEDINFLKTENSELRSRISALEKLCGLNNNTYIESFNTPF